MFLNTLHNMAMRSFALHKALVALTVVLPLMESAVLRCDSNNRDPCTKFPSLCSEGGGLCVIKGPCEYECVCPPEGRRGRDCSRNRPDPLLPKDADQSSNNRGSNVESLLVFPQDLFWDMNHVEKGLELVKMTSPQPVADGPDLTTTPAVRTGSWNDISVNANEITTIKGTTVEGKSKPGQSLISQTTTIVVPLPTKKTHNNHVKITSPYPVVNSPPPKPVAANSPTTLSPLQSAMTPKTPTLSDKVTLSKSAKTQSVPFREGTFNDFTEQSASSPGDIVTASTVANTLGGRHSSPITGTKTSETSSSVSQRGNTPFIDQLEQSLSLGTQTDKSVSLSPVSGHEMFPTFFSEGLQEAAPAGNDKPNAALSRVVQRVFHVPERFPVFKRNHK